MTEIEIGLAALAVVYTLSTLRLPLTPMTAWLLTLATCAGLAYWYASGPWVWRGLASAGVAILAGRVVDYLGPRPEVVRRPTGGRSRVPDLP